VLANPVFAAVVYVGTFMNGPGIVRHAGRGDLVLGAAREIASQPDTGARLQAIAAMFERAGVRCAVTTDIDAALWTKLTINCAFNAISALGRSRYGRMALEPAIREVMEVAVREAVAVARASEVALDEAKLIGEVWKVADAMAEQYSSTAQDVMRGKPTEIDSLNGYIARRGDALGVDVPVNRTLHALVKLREAGDDLA
jgi:2-dehydropantoate 2-reductase